MRLLLGKWEVLVRALCAAAAAAGGAKPQQKGLAGTNTAFQ